MTEIRDIEVDFKIYDGYVAFSAEIVRLALLSPAAFAFFIALAGNEVSPERFLQLIEPGRSWLVASLVFMALAALFGLLHRYCAIDFMCTLVEKQRKGGSMRGDWRTTASSFSIFAAPLSLLAGASLLFIAVSKVLGGG